MSNAVSAVQTKANRFYVDTPVARLYFSYDTCIAAAIVGGKVEDGQWYAQTIKRENIWGSTTGRHMREMGLEDFEIVSESVFDEQLIRAFAQQRHPAALMLASRVDSGEISSGPLEKQWAANVLNKAAADAEEDVLWTDLSEFGEA